MTITTITPELFKAAPKMLEVLEYANACYNRDEKLRGCALHDEIVDAINQAKGII